ncbi:NAD(P)/FAD-dependent oxidoreductase [Ramlibacter albus]|uniref:FAD-binding oxidoreductase n=1 Tax=Ramlibacter albus TaxID=2079448 RepID=A0A923MEC7_9BURK|nr:FAD-binding oxidoreductase [Ramlibacter albus]
MQDYPASWWAASSRHACDFAALREDIETHVAVIGAGFTGLSAAHHLCELGLRCVVLEANRIGWGASGRNGGIAVPRYKFTYPELEDKYGEATALLMYRAAHDAVDSLERIVRQHGLDCGFVRSGHLTPVVSASDVARFIADVEWLASRVHDTAPRMLDAAEASRRIGTAFYSAAYHEPRGGVIHPLEYCITLANALYAAGVRIHCGTPATRWQVEGDGVVVHTPNGRVRAKQLVIASNAYSDLTPAGKPLEKRVVPVASAVIATEPLPPDLRESLLPGGEAATDAKRLTNYYRVLRDGSFFFGGRGGASSRASQRIYDRLRRDMVAIFPQLASVAVRHQWFGLVAMTLDTLPHVGSLDARVHYGMGYNGRGVALSALFGRLLANRVAGHAPAVGPMSSGRFEPIPFHALRVPAKQVAITWKQLVDALGV